MTLFFYICQSLKNKNPPAAFPSAAVSLESWLSLREIIKRERESFTELRYGGHMGKMARFQFNLGHRSQGPERVLKTKTCKNLLLSFSHQ